MLLCVPCLTFACASASKRGNFSIVNLLVGLMVEQLCLLQEPGTQEQKDTIVGVGVGQPASQ
jgi:hypothetical protein